MLTDQGFPAVWKLEVGSCSIPCSCDVMVDFFDVLGGKASSMSVKKMAVVRSVCFVVSCCIVTDQPEAMPLRSGGDGGTLPLTYLAGACM